MKSAPEPKLSATEYFAEIHKPHKAVTVRLSPKARQLHEFTNALRAALGLGPLYGKEEEEKRQSWRPNDVHTDGNRRVSKSA